MQKNKLYNVKEFNNIKEIIYNSAKKYANNIAFVIKHKNGKDVSYENVTYKRLLEDVNKMGTAMFDMGYKDSRIAIVSKNRYGWVITHLSSLLGGNVSVPLDKDLLYEELENSLIRSKADVVVFDEKYVEKITEIKNNKKTNVKEFICITELDGFKSLKQLLNKGDILIKECNREYIDKEIDENQMNILLFTSGTTSASKAVMLSQKNITSNVYALQCVEALYETDVNIAFLPFHHIFGSTCLIVMLAYGVKTVFPDGLRYIKQNLNEYKVSVFVGVPILVEAINKAIIKQIDSMGKIELIKKVTKVSNFLLKFKIDIRRIIFKSVIDALGGKLRFVISGGAPADPEVLRSFNSFGIKTVQGYGLSETSPVVAAENNKFMRQGTVGIPMVNLKVEVVNKDKNGIGEIRVKGPSVMLGYYDMPKITAEVLKDGWFYTGDLGFIDEDGFLHITGRSKNMIVLKNGKKIFPEELEILLNRIDIIAESMVFGMPSKEDANDLKLSVKVQYDKEIAKTKYNLIDENQIESLVWSEIKELNKEFPRYKHIQNLILSDEEFIKTTTKKIKRQEEIKKIMHNI